MKEKIAKWYRLGLWTEDMVKKAVDKAILSAAEADEILKQERN